MSWIAITGQDRSWLCAGTFEGTASARMHLMPRGSLLIETRLSPEGRPQTLLSHTRRYPWPASLSIRAVPGGGIVLVMSQGDDVFHTVLPLNHDARMDILRVTFVWDSEKGEGRLSVENPESDAVSVQLTPAPPPLMLEDIYTLVRRPQLVERDSDVIFFAVSSEAEPIGPMPALTAQVPVLTGAGFRPVGDLECGDTVRTYRSGLVPVLHRVTRRVPAMGSFQPVRLRAPYFGLQRDMIVSPQQRLVIGGSEVEYLFGYEKVLVPASTLVNGQAAIYEDEHMTVRYHGLLLPNHEPVITAGTEIETIYAGRLRRRRNRVAQTLLRDCPVKLLPEHARAGLKVLKQFEAITLAEARAA